MAKQVNNIPFTFDTDEEAKRVLREEAKKLKKIAIKVWKKYLSSYEPKQYIRTGNAQRSIKIGKMRKFDNNEWCLEVTFDNDLAYHDSQFDKLSDTKGQWKQGHAIMLISNGWRVKNGWHKEIERFGYYEGFDYLGKVQKEYNNTKHKGITLEIQWLGHADYTR